MHATPSSPAPEPVVRLIPELAEHGATRYGDTPFLLHLEGSTWRSISFREAARQVRAFAALLARQGIGPSDKVGIQSENRPEWGLAALGALAAGAVLVPLDTQLRAAEMGEILSTAGARALISSGGQLPLAEQVRRERLPDLMSLSLDETPGVPGWPEAQRAFPDAPAPVAHAKPDDVAVLIFTSGTTGRAKGVMLSHRNILSNVEGVMLAFEVNPADRMLSVLPLHHTFENTVGLLGPLRAGASVAYGRGLKSTELREDLRTSRTTILLGVPLLYEKLGAGIRRAIEEGPRGRRALLGALLSVVRAGRRLDLRLGRALLRPVREASGLGGIRLFVSGAAPLSPEVFWELTDLGWTVLEGYGLTECSPVVAANRPERPMPGTVGRPVPGVEVRILEPDLDGDGEIAVRGPNVMLGYFDDPEATAEVLRGGWLHTGDLGRIGRDGNLQITGRLKNMIATAAGKKIYPEEVETRLAQSPLVREVVVVGGRDARGEREEVHAHVVPDVEAVEARAAAQGRTADESFIEQAVREEVERLGRDLAPYKRVKRVFVRREPFPRTSTGKVRRQVAGQAAGSRTS